MICKPPAFRRRITLQANVVQQAVGQRHKKGFFLPPGEGQDEEIRNRVFLFDAPLPNPLWGGRGLIGPMAVRSGFQPQPEATGVSR